MMTYAVHISILIMMICLIVIHPSMEDYIGARTVDPTRYPWFVRLEGPDGGLVCGGCLLHPKIVLSAGHCLENNEISSARVVNAQGKEQVRRVVLAEHMFSTKADLAILVVDTPFQSTPISIGVNETLRHGDDIHGIGYGMDGNKSMANTLQKTTVTFITPGDCYYGAPYQTFFCTKSRRRAACFGDSGGPAFVRHSKKDFLVGITSHGPKDCARKGEFLYSVYTDMTNPMTLKLLLDLLRKILVKSKSL